MLILGAAGAVIVLPGVVPHFSQELRPASSETLQGDTGSGLGVFCQRSDYHVFPVFLLPVMGDLGFANTTFPIPICRNRNRAWACGETAGIWRRCNWNRSGSGWRSLVRL
ncbi:hypothetical protein PO124_27485 [Bacillus licheniformis]|nr:hypothetical protein [Bacillus licheniformis]